MTVIPLSALPARYAGEGRLRYIIDGVLPVGVAVIYGPSGVGKTGLAVATAMAIARGVPWAGRDVAPGPVIYFAAENFLGVLDRFYAAGDHAGGHLSSIGIADREEAQTLSGKGGRAAIERAISEVDVGDPRLIVIDTLATSFGEASQDDSGPATTLMNNLEDLSRRYECAVLVVHHTAKRSGEMRGSQIFYDRADAVLRIEASRNGDPVLKIEKQRSGRTEGSFSFTIGETSIVDGGEEVSVQIVGNLRELSTLGTMQASQEPAVELIDDQGLRVLRGMTVKGVTQVTVKEWQDGCYALWSDAKDGTKRARFSRARKGLEENKKITIKGDFVTVTVTRNNNAGNAPSVTPTVTSSPLKGEGSGNVGADNVWEEALEEVAEPMVRKRSAG